MYRGQKVPGGLVIACRDSRELLGQQKKFSIKWSASFVPATFRFLFGGIRTIFPCRLKRIDRPLVREQGFRRHPRCNCVCSGEVVDLSGRQGDLFSGFFLRWRRDRVVRRERHRGRSFGLHFAWKSAKGR